MSTLDPARRTWTFCIVGALVCAFVVGVPTGFAVLILGQGFANGWFFGVPVLLFIGSLVGPASPPRPSTATARPGRQFPALVKRSFGSKRRAGAWLVCGTSRLSRPRTRGCTTSIFAHSSSRNAKRHRAICSTGASSVRRLPRRTTSTFTVLPMGRAATTR